MTRAEIEAELLAWMRDEPAVEDDERFERLALALFAHQFDHCAPYRRLCVGRGATPERVRRWQEIPAVPTGAFKEVALRSFDASATVRTFRTSGTSSAGRERGALPLDTLALYDASLVPSFERGCLPDLPRSTRVRLIVLAPSADELPDSSLSYMFDAMLRRRGDTGSGFFVKGDALDHERLEGAAASAGGPLLVAGTAFAFVHWCDALRRAGRRLQLPAGARVMETGGFKGRARERARDALYREIEDALGVPPARIVNQYGMTELGSQFYDSVLLDPEGPRRKLRPVWTRVRILDPDSGRELPAGEPGIVSIVDLANTGSVAAVETADLGRTVGDGFEVLGRIAGAEARGCSIAADEMLGG